MFVITLHLCGVEYLVVCSVYCVSVNHSSCSALCMKAAPHVLCNGIDNVLVIIPPDPLYSPT